MEEHHLDTVGVPGSKPGAPMDAVMSSVEQRNAKAGLVPGGRATTETTTTV